MESHLAAYRHRSSVRTAVIFVTGIRQELEMTFIESHGFTEGQGRAQMLHTLSQAYKKQTMDS